MKTLCFLAEGFEDVEALAPVALLRRAGLEVDLCSLNDLNVTGSHGTRVIADITLDDVRYDEYECLMLPGGKGHSLLEADSRVIEYIRKFTEDGKYVAAICAAPTILGRLGLLKNKNYTCFTPMNEDFGGYYHAQYVVEDGKLITARAMAASIDFGFKLIEVLGSAELCQRVKDRVFYEEH